MRVLITSGATREPIDSVRYISNISTGKTGAEIAKSFARAGIDTVLICGQGAERPQGEMKVKEYSSFKNLDQMLQDELGQHPFDAIIHAAAVSDFSVPHPHPGKMSSETDEINLRLIRNFKIVERLKDYAKYSPSIRVIAFKLTDTPDAQEQMRAIQRLSQHSKIDWVVHNDLTEITPASQHSFSIFSRDQKIARGKTKQELADTLLNLIQEKLTS